MCFTWQRQKKPKNQKTRGLVLQLVCGISPKSIQLPPSTAHSSWTGCAACPCLCAWLFQEHCLAFQRTASRWPEGQCSTWASATPRRAIFSRSAPQQGQHEAAQGVGSVSRGGIAAGINPWNLQSCCSSLEGPQLHIRLHSKCEFQFAFRNCTLGIHTGIFLCRNVVNGLFLSWKSPWLYSRCYQPFCTLGMFNSLIQWMNLSLVNCKTKPKVRQQPCPAPEPC